MAMNISRLLSWSRVVAVGTIALILAACGGETNENITNTNQMGGDDDSSVDDSEAVAVSLDSLVGYSQKGPFLKGSTVYLYELSDGRTLKQTNGNFTSIITRDDGRYKFTARDLASQYAMLVVDGYYRNEVTGESSNAPIRLRALTDMRKRSSANVNLLTHLEYDRVYNLVTREHKTVKAAKKQAQAEIFNAFHIDTTGFSESSEDLDVFGSSEADAALLAISILLQGDRTESELTALLAELSDDLSDGKWDDAEKRAEIADSVLSKDIQGKFAVYRSNVEGWGLSTTVPGFEKYVRHFLNAEKGVLEKCGDGNEGEWVEMPYRKAFLMLKCENGVWNTHALKDSRDGHDYRVVKIGGQNWMVENLNFKTDSSFCYKNEESDCTKYGRLYSWNDAKEACPSGWHLPSKTEWETLFSAVGGQSTAGKVLRSADGWENDGAGTDDFGFSGLDAGYESCSVCDDEPICGPGVGAHFWSSTDIYIVNLSERAEGSYLDSANVVNIANFCDDCDYYERATVRCLKDSAE